MLVQLAYGVQRYQIAGAPGWLSSEAFDIEAKPETPFSPTAEESKAMLTGAPCRALWFEREAGNARGNRLQPGGGEGRSQVSGHADSTGAKNYARRDGVLHRHRRDGEYDISLHWTPERHTMSPVTPQTNGEPATEVDAPALITALNEQLGRELERARGPVETLTIEGVERPGSNS